MLTAAHCFGGIIRLLIGPAVLKELIVGLLREKEFTQFDAQGGATLAMMKSEVQEFIQVHAVMQGSDASRQVFKKFRGLFRCKKGRRTIQ